MDFARMQSMDLWLVSREALKEQMGVSEAGPVSLAVEPNQVLVRGSGGWKGRELFAAVGAQLASAKRSAWGWSFRFR